MVADNILQQRPLPAVQGRFAHYYRDLRQGFFLSAMQEVTDGQFCVERGEGCAMVQLGIWFAEPTATPKEKGLYVRTFLPDNPDEYLPFFAKELQVIQQSCQTYTCLSLAALELQWALQAAESFYQAGGDFVELNVHGGYWRYLIEGKMRAMVLAEQQAELFTWVKAFTALPIPLILKFHGKHNRRLLLQALDQLITYDLFAIHMDIRDAKTKKPDLPFVHKLKATYPWFLLVSGYVRSPDDVQALFAAGVDMIGIAEPTLHDAQYIAKLAKGKAHAH
ncbi:MAG: hypothetical protein DYG89_12450 [Caldilinea sp. CFX5]|nr:hypothetical protein [Caldilinea sp. CFX5]